MPPSRSGIADYSSALADELRKRVRIEVFDSADKRFDPAQFDEALYHLGNNPYHAFVYRAALRAPGVAVMHESNLHHLIAGMTIKSNDWDAYVAEVEFDSGPAAREYAERVRTLEVGPDYEGVPMIRRILGSARGVVVHSSFMMGQMRASGFTGPIARIPHGSWIVTTDRNGVRYRLGLDESTPLIGAFGFLKPYKRIGESLRAFRRLVKVEPRAKMILVGEPHPEFPLQSLVSTLDLQAHVRVLGFTPIEEFVEYMGACDVVLNLRYPTVGETSGSMQRALGLGKAVLVSDVGSFQEFPDDVCLKVPIGAGEEDIIFEYLNLLVSRPDLAKALGARARAWAENECSWPAVAAQYAEFLCAVHCGHEWREKSAEAPAVEANVSPPRPDSPKQVPIEYIRGWAAPEAREYVKAHETRLARTLAIIPPGGPEDAILEMGAYLQITPALKTKLGYGRVRGCYYGPLGRTDSRTVVAEDGDRFECEIDHFDAEKDAFPYAAESFSTVLCCELIEHLFQDPMHLMSEVNRILKSGGHLVLTTPNIASLRGVSGILQGYHPGFFHSYIKPSSAGEVDARHNREYTPREIEMLFASAGFLVTRLETGPFRDEPHAEYGWVQHLLEHYSLPSGLRGDGIYAVGKKIGGIMERWPGWLYS
jgi:glycosyltransferase involved in cell wall biosynthesis/SAM-dependent methyltransferase